MSRILPALLALNLAACGTADSTEAAPTKAASTQTATVEAPKVDETSMDEVEAKLASGDCHVYDANRAGTRTENGVVEGAVLLTNYNDYDLAVLPEAKDAQLVFYCANTLCKASDGAAIRAQDAGYTQVSVMREGIKGWVEAGKKTVAFEG